jgi:hypothetical protein
MGSFDHLAVAGATLDAAAAHVEVALGRPMGPGGRHAAMGTHNRLTGLAGDAYLEAIAVDPAGAPPERPRWFGLDRHAGPPRLTAWIVRVDDLDAALAAYPEAGRPLALSRGALRWRMAVPDDGALPFDGCFPALIEWGTAPPSFPDAGLRLLGLTLRHPQADALRDRLAGLIVDPRVTVEPGPAAMEARIATPDGPRLLT